MATANFEAGGYCYIPAVFQYSGGVAALPGYAIRRLRFRDPVPLAEGFRSASGDRRAENPGGQDPCPRSPRSWSPP